MKRFIKVHKLTLIGGIIGMVAGYLYWHFIGCNSGSCAITSQPINSSLYGAAMGGLLVSSFKKKENQK